MFEGFLAVPLHFTIEFLGFLVTAGGAALVLSRPNLVPGPSANRIAAGLGLIVLAAAQVLHGGSFYPTDGDQILVSIRALGFALLLIGIVGDVKPASAVALWGYQVEEPLLFAPAGAAVLLSLAAASTARKEGLGFYSRLSLAALVLAASEALTAATPDAEFGGGAFERFALAAHGLKFVGFVLLGAWLWNAVRSSIRTRFVASFGVLLVAVILALSTALTGVIANNVQTEELIRVRTQARNAAEQFSFPDGERLVELNDQAAGIAGLPEVGRRIGEGISAQSVAESVVAARSINFDADFLILDPDKRNPGAAGQGPQLFNKQGDPKPTRLKEEEVVFIGGSKVVTEVRRGRARASASPARIDRHVALIAARRLDRPSDGKRIGIVIVGEWVDALTVERISENAAEVPVTLFVQDRIEATLLPRSRAEDLAIDPALRSDLGGTGLAQQQTIGSSSFYVGYSSIKDGDGQSVATLAISNPSSLVASTRNSVTRILFLAAMLIGVLALALAYLSGRRITRPIQVLTATAGAVREGDLSARAEVEGEDEVGVLGETFNEMTDSLLRFTDDLRKAARQEHDLRERIETIINSMADGLVAVDADLNVLAFNPEAEAITGVSAEEAIGERVTKVLHARDMHGEDIELPIFSLSEGTMADVYIKPRDGDRVPVAIASAILTGEDETEVTGGVAVIRNMTREREIERMKTEFLSNISHELRTPLTPIKGYAEILGRKEVPFDKVKQFVGGILESTARLERIVELLVDFSAMEAGRLAPRAGQVDMREMLGALAEKWDARTPQHEVTTETPDEEEIAVVGDERLLRQSLEEILDNAVKFSPDGGSIRLAARPAPSGNGSPEARMIEVSVTDQGIGISEEELPQIFSDFHQLDGSETRTYGGLGLGLAFVQRIVAAHAGTLRVESQPGSGTRLTLSLPAAAPGEAEQAGDEGSLEAAEPPAGETVEAVED